MAENSTAVATSDSAADLAGSALRLFNRAVEVTLINQPAKGQNYFDTTGNATLITDMRVQFEVKKNLGSTPNSCNLTITNLAKETRGRFERKPAYVILRGGHDGVLRPLFSGNVTYGKSELKSPAWETKVQVADGGRAYSHARMRTSYSPPISFDRVLADAAASMGLKIPPELSSIPELKQTLSGSMSVQGSTRDLLTRLLAPFGFSWSIQDGRLQVLRGGGVNARTAWLIDVDAGMIASPEGSMPHKPGGVSELTIQVLLFPEISPGDVIQVVSRAYDGGFFRVNDIAHSGDTHGSDWKTAIKATPLSSPPPRRGRGRR